MQKNDIENDVGNLKIKKFLQNNLHNTTGASLSYNGLAMHLSFLLVYQIYNIINGLAACDESIHNTLAVS